ncbi:MAG: RNaseH domain-containing protein [Cyanobacteria bacterium J06560_6]
MNQYYIQPGQIKKLRDVALAFTVPDNLPPVAIGSSTLVWTKQALKTFCEIHKEAYKEEEKFKELPYQSLRGGLNVGIKDITRIESHLGLKSSLIRQIRTKAPAEYDFARLLDSDNDNKLERRLQSILDEWVVNDLKSFCEDKDVPDKSLNQIQNLIEHNDLIQIRPFSVGLLPWLWQEETGTTKAKDGRAYTLVVDHLARLIAGQEIFAGCGPMRRVISSYGRFVNSTAQLMTTPISIEEKGRFSLVITIQLVTFPSVHQPIIAINVSKRRWLDSIESPDRDYQDISGYAFTQELPDRTFNFKVISRKINDEWTWKTAKDFGAVRRQLELGMQVFSGQDIVLGQADTNRAHLVLTHRNGLSKHGVDVGVPEIDKLEAFIKIDTIVRDIGLSPFVEYEAITNRSRKRQKEKEVKLPTLLSAMLESERATSFDPTPDYVNKLSDSQLNQQLEEAFRLSLENIRAGRKVLQFSQPKQSEFEALKAIRERNRTALKRLYPGEKLSLFIFYQDKFEEELKFLKALAQLLWGSSVEVIANGLPPDTHGSKSDLPNPKKKAKERSKQRVTAWKSIANQIARRESRTFCLVLAAKFYTAEDGTIKRDDPINKPSTRRALASIGGACVQFITQMDKTKKNNKADLVDYSRRGQQALKDLLSAHSGRVEGIKEKVEKCLKTSAQSKPKEILAITIVRKQKGRARGLIEGTFLPIAIRIQVETGRCDIRCAHEGGDGLQITEWERFPKALSRISSISPVKIGDSSQIRRTNFMKFVRHVISDSVERKMQPLVIVDSTNCSRLWSWLADVRMDANNIHLKGISDWMHEEWSGARIVRIRQGFTPAIIEEKVRNLVKTSVDDERNKNELKQMTPDLTIPSASSTLGKLFRLSTMSELTGCVTYFSIGSRAVQQQWRGQSCYQSTPAHDSVTLPNDDDSQETDSKKKPEKLLNAAGIEVRALYEKPPFTEQWPTPNPLEIVVTLRQEEDDPDDLATLVESLRYVMGHYAESTTLPAPLFFERVVRDYISDFSIKEEQGDENA